MKRKELQFIQIDGSKTFTIGQILRWHWASLMRARQSNNTADKMRWLNCAAAWREIYSDRHNHPHYSGI